MLQLWLRLITFHETLLPAEPIRQRGDNQLVAWANHALKRNKFSSRQQRTHVLSADPLPRAHQPEPLPRWIVTPGIHHASECPGKRFHL